MQAGREDRVSRALCRLLEDFRHQVDLFPPLGVVVALAKGLGVKFRGERVGHPEIIFELKQQSSIELVG